MIRARCDFYSESLGLSTSMTVLLPQSSEGQIGLVGGVRERTPVLYLLHGLSDDATSWGRRSSIERYASALGIAVVMPQVHRSFYADEVHGNHFWTFISEELPALVATTFRVSDRREDTFVAGLSMGGYGALKLGLRHPERFAAIGAFSSAVDLDEVKQFAPDVLALVRDADPATTPKLWISCGTEDWLYPYNVHLVDDVRAAGHDPHVEFPPGDHEWDVWDDQIERFLAWLPLS